MTLQKESLQTPSHHPIACATALAVLTTEGDSNKKTLGAMSPVHLLEAVQSFFIEMKISLSQINRHIRQWIKNKWMELLEDGRVRPTKKGIHFLEALSESATAI